MISTEANIWTRIIRPDGHMTPGTAQAILKLFIPESDKKRMRVLAMKNRAGEVTEDEEAELDNYCRVGQLLNILKSQARQVLGRSR